MHRWRWLSFFRLMYFYAKVWLETFFFYFKNTGELGLGNRDRTL